MTHVVTEACIGVKDSSCVAVCPVDCIHDLGPMMVIDPGECIDCGACIPECPVEAIYTAQDLPSALARFADAGAAFADDPERARALIVLDAT
jgi:ferredoxin